MMIINALGKACPTPVLLAKKQIESGDYNFEILVDNETSVSNLTRFAQNQGFQVKWEKEDNQYCVHIFSDEKKAIQIDEKDRKTIDQETVDQEKTSKIAYFVTKDYLGEGDNELGYNLLKMALYTLSEGDLVPKAILFMNRGVKLAASEDQQVFDSIEQLIQKGCKIILCGTCLNYYQLTEQVKHGTISNMYDILNEMEEADKVISL
jgi:selenium metabolism protein YedF